MQVTHKFALLDCEDSEKWLGHEQIWLSLFKREEDEWEIFRVFEGKLPTNFNYKGVIISGSHYSVYENLSWMEDLSQYLRDLHSKPENSRPKVGKRFPSSDEKVYAVCFGCQILAHALGGCVRQNPSGRFILGSEEIRCTPLLSCHPLVQAGEEEELSKPLSFRLLESHGDCVSTLPERDDVQLLAYSDSCEVEMFGVGDKTLAVQFHPELTPELMTERILPAVRSRMNEEEVKKAEYSLSLALDDRRFLRLAVEFIHI
jgi:GMP synthase-like glutamine amidotransferase